MCPVELTVSLAVTRQLYIGHLPIEQLSGLKDEQTGLVWTNAFKTKGLNPNEVQETWTKVAEGEPLPFQPVLTAMGLISWGQPREEQPQMNRQQRRHGFPTRKA